MKSQNALYSTTVFMVTNLFIFGPMFLIPEEDENKKRDDLKQMAQLKTSWG